jgi:hypothetical protein
MRAYAPAASGDARLVPASMHGVQDPFAALADD